MNKKSVIKTIATTSVALTLMIGSAIAVAAEYYGGFKKTSTKDYYFGNEMIRMTSFVYEHSEQKMARADGLFYHEFPKGMFMLGYYDSNGYVRARVETRPFFGSSTVVAHTDSGRVFGKTEATAQSPKEGIGIACTYCGRA